MSPLFEAISGTRLPRIMLGVFVLGVLVIAGLAVGQYVYTWTGNSTFSGIATTLMLGRHGLIAGVCGIAAVVVAACWTRHISVVAVASAFLVSR